MVRQWRRGAWSDLQFSRFSVAIILCMPRSDSPFVDQATNGVWIRFRKLVLMSLSSCEHSDDPREDQHNIRRSTKTSSDSSRFHPASCRALVVGQQKVKMHYDLVLRRLQRSPHFGSVRPVQATIPKYPWCLMLLELLYEMGPHPAWSWTLCLLRLRRSASDRLLPDSYRQKPQILEGHLRHSLRVQQYCDTSKGDSV